MEAELFNPYDLHPLASLNRRVIIALPGIEPDWIGQTGASLCSKRALIALIEQQAAALELEGVPPADFPRQLNALLAGLEGPVRAQAEAIARRHGQQIGYLIASILLAPGGLTTPLDPWEAAYLEHWRHEVTYIGLGGGRANGLLGQWVAAAAEDVLQTCGLGQIRVEALPDPSYLPLSGAARSISPGDWQVAAVADFGGTHAKSGLAFYNEAGALLRLRVLPQVSTGGLSDPGQAGALAQAIVAVLADAIRRAPPDLLLAPEVICSVAAYLEGGQPAITPGRSLGAYALRELGDDLPTWFSAQLSAAGGRPLRLRFAHDCDIAAVALAGRPRSAVVMLGTALGVGFVPPEVGLRATESIYTT
jgi:hypothetical protein